jgi:Fe-S-cluster containining protein
MAPNPRRRDARLQELYDRVPSIECKGMCHGACCFIDASIRERERMEQASGRKLDTLDAKRDPEAGGTQRDRRGGLLARYRCSMLTNDGRCSVYDLRPMICRLYGVAEGLECKHGCKPERMLTAGETVELVVAAMHAGGYAKGMLESSIEMRKRAEDNDAALRYLRSRRRVIV